MGCHLQIVVGDPASEEAIDIEHLTLSAPSYQRAQVMSHRTEEPHEAPLGHLADLVQKIVAVEGPIHVDELARRISSAFGKTRTGTRIAEATRRAISSARQRDANLRQIGDFVLTAEQGEAPPIRDRRAETCALLKVGYLPPMEIAAAAHRVRSECGAMPPEEMTRAVARLLGFKRVGADLSKAILAVVMQD